jgi:hypothetical protein
MLYGVSSESTILRTGLNSSDLSGTRKTNDGNNRKPVKMNDGGNGLYQQLNVIKAIDSYSVSYRYIQTTEQT